MFLCKFLKRVGAKTLVALAGFTLVLGVGGTTVSLLANQTEVTETKAATATTVYYAVDTTYTVKCNVHFGSNESDPWGTYTMTKVSGTDGIYKATFTDKWDGLATLQFQLYDGETHKGEVQPISSWTGPSTYNNKLYYNGGWTTTFKEVKKSTSLSPNTGRVFFNNSGTHWASGGTLAVYAWGGDATKSIDSNITMEGTYYHIGGWFQDIQDDDSTYYGYADIPTNVSGYKIAKLSNGNYVGWSLSYDSSNTFNPDSFAYVRYGQTDGDYIDSGGAKNGKAGPSLMTAVISAYDTCSSSVLNGYGAYGALNTNFYSHATDAAKTATATSLGGKSATIQEHFEGMASRSSGNNGAARIPGSSNEQSPLTLTLWIVLGAGILGMGAIGTAYFVSKKKKRHQA